MGEPNSNLFCDEVTTSKCSGIFRPAAGCDHYERVNWSSISVLDLVIVHILDVDHFAGFRPHV